MKDLSINAIIFIIIVVFVNIGFTVKLFDTYYKKKKEGVYIRERPLREQIEQRVMKSFGNKDDLDRLVADFIRYKESSEKATDSLKEETKELKRMTKDIEDLKIKFGEERVKLQKEIWTLEDSLSQAKSTIRENNCEISNLTDRLKIAKELLFKKHLEEHSRMPGLWHIPTQ